MKLNQQPRTRGSAQHDDAGKKTARLAPVKKSGKDRYHLYGELEEQEDELYDYRERESVLDYFDDGQEDL